MFATFCVYSVFVFVKSVRGQTRHRPVPRSQYLRGRERHAETCLSNVILKMMKDESQVPSKLSVICWSLRSRLPLWKSRSVGLAEVNVKSIGCGRYWYWRGCVGNSPFIRKISGFESLLLLSEKVTNVKAEVLIRGEGT